MIPSPAPADLAGAYRLRPGRRPAIDGARPLLEGRRLARLLQGLPAARAPDTCAAVFTLCAHAHRRTSEAAVRAAQGLERAQDDLACLHFETARDHLRAIALDWPARAGTPPQLDWLRGSPLRIAGPGPQQAEAVQAGLRDFGAWLAESVLHRAPGEWLAGCASEAALGAWCKEHAATFPPARILVDARAQGAGVAIPCAPLQLLDDDEGMRDANLHTLAASLAREPDFAQFPHWHGQPRENGPWTRQRKARATPPSSAWMRLAARWTELVALAAADGAPLLHHGALQLAPGEAIAWCEMARGLLLHWVRLDGNARVRDYRVLAPTEWNFHPQGALARALERLAPDDTATAAVLGAAFDACVPCTVAAT